jgi:hypothetical protein
MVTVILFVIWSGLVVFTEAADLTTDPPLVPLFKTNTHLINRLVPFRLFLPRNDVTSKEITVDYGDQTIEKLLLQSKENPFFQTYIQFLNSSSF